MSVGLLGRKLGMTQVFDKKGRAIGATVLEVGPCRVTRIRTQEKDGYTAVQFGYGQKKNSRSEKSAHGQFKGYADGAVPRFVKEIRTSVLDGLEPGKEIRVDLFRPRERIDISGVSVGRGFQGVVKRHRFIGGPGSHGAKFGRESGSIGQHTYPGRVFKGLRMAGHMGAEQVTQQNTEILDVIPEHNVMVVRGSVPGSENMLLVIRVALKKGLPRKNWNVPEPLPEEKEEEVHVALKGEGEKGKAEAGEKKAAGGKKKEAPPASAEKKGK